MALVPAARVRVLNLDFSIADKAGWVIVEGELCVGEGDQAPLLAISLPLIINKAGLEALVGVSRPPKSSRRRIPKS